MIRFLYSPFLAGKPAVGLLLFRIVTGGALMLHGWTKIQHPFSWMSQMGGHVPAFFQMMAAIAEFGGGLALVLGLLTPLACALIAINMLVAIFTVHVPHGGAWVGGKGSYESALGYLVSAVMLFLTGPGKYSVDARLFEQRLSREAAASPRKETVAVAK